MTGGDRQRFSTLCLSYETTEEGKSIGTYGEKRLHRILKAFVSEDATTWEFSVGKYVADVFCEGRITEIQTGSLRPLSNKLSYYLKETDYDVTLLLPVIAEKTILRIDGETGEMLHTRLSPKKGRARDVLPELYWIKDCLGNPRLTIRVLLIRAEEHRFSERMRYRKEGAYDAELYPKELLGEERYSQIEDFRVFLPDAERFRAAEYGRFLGLKGRALYSALNTLCAMGLLEKEKEERAAWYRRT